MSLAHKTSFVINPKPVGDKRNTILSIAPASESQYDTYLVRACAIRNKRREPVADPLQKGKKTDLNEEAVLAIPG